MTAEELQRCLGTEPYRLIPRCVITQSSGKQRVIDDAYVGLQSERSSDANKLTLCSALRPAQHLQYAYAYGQPLLWEAEGWESGGEDWPDAYRFCPMSRDEALCCIVTFFHHEWQQPDFMIYTYLYWIAFWSPPCSHVLQSIQSFCGSVIASICFLFDEFVFR